MLLAQGLHVLAAIRLAPAEGAHATLQRGDAVIVTVTITAATSRCGGDSCLMDTWKVKDFCCRGELGDCADSMALGVS
jgi:hypothetical protein